MNEHVRELLEQAQGRADSELDGRLADLDEAAEAAPDAPEVYIARGDCYLDAGALALAIDEYSYAVELDGERLEAWRKLAECEMRRGQWEAAAEALTEAAELEPEDASLWQRLGDVWLAAGEHGRAIGAFEAGMEEDDSLPGLYLGRARASLAMDLLEDAAEDVTHLERIDPSGSALLLRAQLQLQEGQPERAVASLGKLLDRQPAHVEAMRLRGDAQWELGDIAAAEADYRRSLTEDAEDVDTRVAIAECRLALGDTLGAVEMAETIAAEVGAEDSGVLELLARALVAAGRNEEALATIARGLASEGDPAPLYLRRGLIHLAAGRKNLAWRDARWAIDADGEYAEAYALRGRLALELEGVEEAVADLDAAVALDPELGAAWAWRGRARELGGDIVEADSNWAEAEALLDDDDPLRAEVTGWRRQAG